MASAASAGSRAALLRQWDQFDVDLAHLGEALLADSTPPPIAFDEPFDDFPCVTSTAPPSFPLTDSVTSIMRAAARPALSPDLLQQLDEATEASLDCEPLALYRPIGQAPVAEVAAFDPHPTLHACGILGRPEPSV